MQVNNRFKKNLYFTQDHEWIDFQGSVAYTGICRFKLTGFKSVEEIKFYDAAGIKMKGEIIASIHYKEYQIEAHMPVDGKIIQINDHFLEGKYELLLSEPESIGWVALIIPFQPYERNGLLLPKEYSLNTKSKYAKS
ncbi:hypothetical protein ESA94_08885 [Lacibacter luteus]|uniref:Glycine cleavage system protein H n=1 Tax=Lacibacter luteus TaxID=2508719 RepID=A0A4Q1CIW1_9BACT|nr:hypothetical protein [Lacibacter luteus]RXK60571.1 hypothetical protein ESA94_08885 [Lacibacter luteus]